MKEVIDFLKANPRGVLATVSQGKPDARPWGFMFEDEGRLWFCTANTKTVFQQLNENANIVFTASSEDMVTVRIRGQVVFSKDLGMKQRIIEQRPLVKSIFQTADNPTFEVFYVEHGTASLADFSGQPPKMFEF